MKRVERIKEGIDPGDSFETVISPFIKFYAHPSTGSRCFRESRSRAPPRFSMACDLITEIVLIIVDERRKEGRGGRKRGTARGISSGCYMPGTLCKKDRLLMTASYSEARSRSDRAGEGEIQERSTLV